MKFQEKKSKKEQKSEIKAKTANKIIEIWLQLGKNYQKRIWKNSKNWYNNKDGALF